MHVFLTELSVFVQAMECEYSVNVTIAESYHGLDPRSRYHGDSLHASLRDVLLGRVEQRFNNDFDVLALHFNIVFVSGMQLLHDRCLLSHVESIALPFSCGLFVVRAHVVFLWSFFCSW